MGQRGRAPTFITMSYKGKDALRRAAKAQALRKKGYSLREICNELGRSNSTICYYLKTDVNASILAGLDEEEREKRHQAELAPIEMKEDVDVIKFCEDPSYLNFHLNPVQRLVLKAFYGVPFTSKEREIMEGLVKEGKTTWEEGKKYRELVVVAGMKAGKTILASVIACYEEFSIYRLGEAWKTYGFPKGEIIFIINVATSGEQAEDTIYAQTVSRMKNSPFYSLRPYQEKERTVKFRDDGVRIRCGHSNSSSIVGKLAKLVLFDELARFKDKGGRSSAEAVYTALTRSIEPFGENGKIVSISSPLWEKDKIMSLYRLSKEIPNMLGFWLSTWFMNPRITRHALRYEFKKDPEAARRDFGADPSKPKEVYYRVPSKIKETFERVKNIPSPIDGKGTLKDEFRGNLEFDYYLHGDPSAFNNAFGLCLGHRLGDVVYLDLVHGFEAGEGEIDVEEIKNIILELMERNFKLKKVTFDTWAAVSVWQALQGKGIKPSNLFVLKEQHDELKRVIYADNLIVHYSRKLKDEITELLLLRGMKVDHPAGGSKDLVDAAAAVTFHCMKEETVEVASGAKDPKPEEEQLAGSRYFGRRQLWA